MTESLSARELFRAAYENRYTWDKNFPGYTADTQLREGDRVFTGKVHVTANLKAEVTGIEDEAAKQAIHEQAWEIAVHRVRRAFEETHGKNEFDYGATDETGAVEILVRGKTAGDRYKVRNNVICLVHRHIHDVVVTINTHTTFDTGAGYLAHTYDSIYHDPQTGEPKSEISQFEDTFEQVGDYFVLTQRVIKSTQAGQPIVSEFSFSNVRMLQPAVV